MSEQNESTEYFLGKVAAHAFADEWRELLAGYEKLAQGTGLLPPELLKGMGQAGQLAKKTVTSVPKAAPGALGAAKKYVAPVAKGGKMVMPVLK